MSWWAATPTASLSQGDVIGDVPVAVVVHPLAQLTRQDAQRLGSVWVPSPTWQPDHQGMGNLLAKGRVIPVIVLTESCQLDKKESKDRVIIAPVYPASGLGPEEQAMLWAQQRKSKLPLPEAPQIAQIGPSYADLRMTTAIDVKYLDVGHRIAQLSQEGVHRLQMQLLAFFTGLDTRALLAAAMSLSQGPEPGP